jgi:signal transduction histidine kinase/PAS domain-containing protein
MSAKKASKDSGYSTINRGSTSRRTRPLRAVRFQQQAQLRRRYVAQIPRWRRPLTGYLFSIPFIALTFLGIQWAHHLLPHFLFFNIPLLLAVMLVALIWGVGPGLFSTLLSTAALAYYYIPAFQNLNFTNWNSLLQTAPFFLSGVIIAVITGQREAARRRAHFAEQEEQERAGELEATFEAMADGVIVYDDTAHIVRTNAAARKLFELDTKPRAKFSLRFRREQRHELVILDEQSQPFPDEQSPLSRILNGEVLTSTNAMDVILRKQNGDEVQLNVTGAPVYNFGGNPIGAICVFRDVTERRQLERRTHDALNALVEMAKALVQLPEKADTGKRLSVDASQHTDPRPYGHPAVEDQTSASVAEVARRLAELTCSVLGCRRVVLAAIEPETEVLHPVAVVGLSPEQERFWWANQQRFNSLNNSPNPELISRLQANEVLEIDLTGSLVNGKPIENSVSTVLVAPMFVGDHLVGTLSLDYGGVRHEYTDEEKELAGAIAKLAALVIERERLLDERAKAQANELALREANRRMDEFLGMASHELRTPLTAINGNIQLAKRQLKKSINDDGTFADDMPEKLELLQTLLDRAERQVKVQNRLVGDLMDVTSIQANKIALKLEYCDLAAIVRKAVQEQCQATPNRTIHLRLPEEETVPVVADDDRIAQVIMNYLSNAIKYSPADRPVEVSLAIEKEVARVSVCDQGPGLSITEQQSIWERFYQVDRIKALSNSASGLGLGLHICKFIIEQHQGQVGVQSAPGDGSTFWFTLPLARDEE